MKFKRLMETAKLPTRKFQSDAGLDVYTPERLIIYPGLQVIARTGIALVEAPEDSVIQVWPKSGLDSRFGLHTGAGIIDPNYRGEVLILLKNMGKDAILLEAGEPIAQLVLLPCRRPTAEWAEETSETERGISGGITNADGPQTIEEWEAAERVAAIHDTY